MINVSAIGEDEYIGNSLSKINGNFDILKVHGDALYSMYEAITSIPVPYASNNIHGIVKIGNGLSITTDGVVSNNIAQYQFEHPLVKSDGDIISLKYDNKTLGLGVSGLFVKISDTDTWVVNNSAETKAVNSWYNTSSSTLLTKNQLSSILADFIPRDIRNASSWTISNTAKNIIVFQNLNSFIDTRDWLDLYKLKIVSASTWVTENSSNINNAVTWVRDNSSGVNNNQTPSGTGQILINTSEFGNIEVKKILLRGNGYAVEQTEEPGTVLININNQGLNASNVVSTVIQCDQGVRIYQFNGFTTSDPTNYIVNYDGKILIPQTDYEITPDRITLKFSIIETGKFLCVLALQNKILPNTQYTPQTNVISNLDSLSIYGDNTLLGTVTGINVTGESVNVICDNSTGVATINFKNTTTNTTVQNAQNNDIPVGTLLCFPNNKVPAGWLLCDGSSIDIKYSDTYNNLLTAIYCGDELNNGAEYGFLSDSPKRDTEYYITIENIFSETQTTLGVRDDGVLSVSVKGGSGNFKLKIGNKETTGTATENLTITNLNTGTYLNCSIIDTVYNRVIYFNLTIQYGTQNSFITYKNVQFLKGDTFASTSRSVNGRYLFLPDLTEEHKRNKALFYCIKYI